MNTETSLVTIPVDYQEDRITVLGRDLHKALEIGTPYTTWFKRMCEYGFTEGDDYIKFLTFSEEMESGAGRHPENHQMTLDMAKEIAMLQRTSQGRQIRRYFIELEKKYLKQQTTQLVQPIQVNSTSPMVQAVSDAGQLSQMLNQYFGLSSGLARVHALNMIEKEQSIDLQDIKLLLPPVSDNEVTTLNPTQIASRLSAKTGSTYTSRIVNIILSEMGFQDKVDKEWKLTEDGKQYGAMWTYEKNGHSGLQLRWNESVVEAIIAHLKKSN